MTVSHLSVAFIPCFPAETEEYMSLRLGLVCECKGKYFLTNTQYLKMMISDYLSKRSFNQLFS